MSSSAPSAWLVAWRSKLAEAARLGPVLDLACGRGRNALAAARWGIPIVGIDRNAAFLTEMLLWETTAAALFASGVALGYPGNPCSDQNNGDQQTPNPGRGWSGIFYSRWKR